ncbi:MAG: hypothetical protein KAS46_07840, partial [Candidatus Aureabacteria bacterium]|nr:hypothetical protein [Candidatus Auribacterota bacterium]
FKKVNLACLFIKLTIILIIILPFTFSKGIVSAKRPSQDGCEFIFFDAGHKKPFKLLSINIQIKANDNKKEVYKNTFLPHTFLIVGLHMPIYVKNGISPHNKEGYSQL